MSCWEDDVWTPCAKTSGQFLCTVHEYLLAYSYKSMPFRDTPLVSLNQWWNSCPGGSQ